MTFIFFIFFWRYLALFGVSADRIGSGFRRAAKGSSDALMESSLGSSLGKRAVRTMFRRSARPFRAAGGRSLFSFHADTLSPGRNAVKLYLHYFV
jgi:hypothetical protein